jgi:uncharacterized membrane-anchored protein YhcB (DUF1043 family)
MWPGITGVIIGILIGGTAVAIWLKKRGGSGETVASLKRENAQFREEVNEHFVQTAELINQLTDSYKAVFDHLSEGAEKLVDAEVVRERMPQVGHEEVRLKRIGTVKPSDAEGDQEAPDPSDPPEAEDGQASQSVEQESSASESSEPKSESEPEKDPVDDAAGAETADPSEEETSRQESDKGSHDKDADRSEESLSDDDKDGRRER